MKKLNSILMLAMMMIAALTFTACGSDDDDNGGDDGGGNGSQQTLTIDGKSYFYSVDGCNVNQTKNSGMYLTVNALENREFTTNGHQLTAYISPNKVAELKVGDKFENGSMSIQVFRTLTEISLGTYMWNVVEGNITITKITDMELTIQINGLKLKHKNSGVEHTISGTAVLNSGVYSSDNKLLSFADAIK